MTLFFAVTTAACLIGLAAFAVHSDSVVRHRTDQSLLAQARQFTGTATVDNEGGVDSTSLASGADLSAVGSMPAGFIDAHGISYATPSQQALPASAVIDHLFASMARTHAAVFTTAAGLHGQQYRWGARPVPGGDTAMALVGTPSTLSFSHTTLTQGLAIAVTVLVLLASMAGHALSGRAMRPALRQVEQQEQFLREAAHEIRTPLSTLRLIAESGLRHPDTARDSLEAILDRLTTMNSVVGTLLVRARAESGTQAIETRPLRLDQLVEVTIDDLHLGDRVEVTTSEAVIDGNAELLAQAVRNLVDNAVRHGGDGPVLVTVEGGVITVTDAGDGSADGSSPPSALESSSPGTGTGLSIVRWVAELHAARFDLTRTGTGGARATLAFPDAFPASRRRNG